MLPAAPLPRSRAELQAGEDAQFAERAATRARQTYGDPTERSALGRGLRNQIGEAAQIVFETTGIPAGVRSREAFRRGDVERGLTEGGLAALGLLGTATLPLGMGAPRPRLPGRAPAFSALENVDDVFPPGFSAAGNTSETPYGIFKHTPAPFEDPAGYVEGTFGPRLPPGGSQRWDNVGGRFDHRHIISPTDQYRFTAAADPFVEWMTSYRGDPVNRVPSRQDILSSLIRRQRAIDGTAGGAAPDNFVSMDELINVGSDPEVSGGLPQALDDYLGHFAVGRESEGAPLLGTPDIAADPMASARRPGFGSRPPALPRAMPNEDRRWPMFGTRATEADGGESLNWLGNDRLIRNPGQAGLERLAELGDELKYVMDADNNVYAFSAADAHHNKAMRALRDNGVSVRPLGPGAEITDPDAAGFIWRNQDGSFTHEDANMVQSGPYAAFQQRTRPRLGAPDALPSPQGPDVGSGGGGQRLRVAIRDPRTGHVYTGGENHGELMDRIPARGDEPASGATWNELAADENSGFVTSDGRFLSRTEAQRAYGESTSERIDPMRALPDAGQAQGGQSGAHEMGNLGTPWRPRRDTDSPVRFYFGEDPNMSYSDGPLWKQIDRRIQARDWSMEDVRLSDLTAGGQDVIEPGFRRVPWPDGYGNGPPVIIRHNGRMYIEDGNHRLTALAERGDQTVRVAVIDADNLSAPSVPDGGPRRPQQNKSNTPALKRAFFMPAPPGSY